MRFRASGNSTERRLSGLDAGFLSLEMVGQPMQCLAVGVLRSGISGPLSVHDLHRHLTNRLENVPAFRWRVVPVPFGLAQPVLLEDPSFDLDNHLFHTVLSTPGGPRELDVACAQLASRQLDRDRPLWRMTLIDGLTDGRQAIVLEVHHALMDGAALRTTLARILAPEQPAVSPPSERSDRMPTRWQLVTGGLAQNAHAMARLPELIRRTRRASVAVRQRQAAVGVTVPMADIDTPLSPVNYDVRPERRFARAALPLETVLAVKEAAGVTVNDLVLSLVGGALRDYFAACGTLPDAPLMAFVPVGIDESLVTPRAEGNRWACLTTSLATDVADPWERLQRISAATAEAKARLDLAGRDMVAEWLEYVPPMLMGPILRRSQKARRRPSKRRAKIGENVVVSNLRGPPAPWRLGSAVVEEIYLAGPPNGGLCVNFALWDYASHLLFGILSFADPIDDPEELAEGLSRSLAELVATTRSHRNRRPGYHRTSR